MEKEVSSAIHLAVKLLAISALIYIVIFTVIIGKSFRDDVVDTALTMENSMEFGQLSSLSVGDSKIMPKVSLYYILYKESGVVDNFEYNKEKYKIASSGEWIKKNGKGDTYGTVGDILKASGLDGKVVVDISKEDTGNYEIIVKDIKDGEKIE